MAHGAPRAGFGPGALCLSPAAWTRARRAATSPVVGMMLRGPYLKRDSASSSLHVPCELVFVARRSSASALWLSRLATTCCPTLWDTCKEQHLPFEVALAVRGSEPRLPWPSVRRSPRRQSSVASRAIRRHMPTVTWPPKYMLGEPSRGPSIVVYQRTLPSDVLMDLVANTLADGGSNVPPGVLSSSSSPKSSCMSKVLRPWVA